MLFKRLLHSSIGLGIVLTSSAISSLYIEYYARKNIKSKIQKVMEDPQIKIKVKSLSEKVLKRVLQDDSNKAAIISLIIKVMQGQQTRITVKETFDSIFSESSLDDFTLQVSTKFSKMLLEKWVNSKEFGKDW